MAENDLQALETGEIAIMTEESIRDRIYTIRGQQVMLDSDLAEIYGYTTRQFNGVGTK